MPCSGVVVTTNAPRKRRLPGPRFRWASVPDVLWDVTFRPPHRPTGGLLGSPGRRRRRQRRRVAAQGTGYYLGWPFHVWSQEIVLATPCDVRNGAEPITLYDLDIPYSQANLYQLQERSRGAPGHGPTSLRSGRSGSPGLRTSPSNAVSPPLATGASGATHYVLPDQQRPVPGRRSQADTEQHGQSNKIRVRIPL